MKLFAGIITPVVTMFDQSGNIDSSKTMGFIRHIISTGVHGLFVAGSTGDASLMTSEQRKQIIDIGVEASEGKVPVIAGTGSNNTKSAVDLSKYAQRAGAQGVMVFVPHYPRPTQEGIYMHYRAISEAVDIPVFIYNYPAQYGVDISPETVARLAEERCVRGIKDTHVDLDHTSDIIRLGQGLITVWHGYDTKLLASLSMGGDGGVCTISNVIPEDVVSIYELFVKGDLRGARKAQLAIYELARALACRSDNQPVKEALNMLGHEVGDAVLPSTELLNTEREALRIALARLGRLPKR